MHILGPEGVDGERGHEGRIDAAAQAQHGAPQAILGEVVVQAADQGLVDELHGLWLLVLDGLYLLHVHCAAPLLEVRHLAEHAARGVHGHGAAGEEIGAFAAGAVDVDEARVEGLDNLAHAVARAVRALIVKYLTAAAHHHVGLFHMSLGELLEVLVEAYGQTLVVEVDDLHTLAAHEAALLVGGEVLLGHHAAYGAVLYEHDGVAEPLVLDLQRHAHEEGAVLRELYQALQGGLGPLLQVGVAGGGEERGAAEGARREDGEQSLARRLGAKLGGYPFKVILRLERKDVMLNDMYLHRFDIFQPFITHARRLYCVRRHVFAPFSFHPLPYGPPTDPVRPFFSSSSVVLQCGTEELLKNY